MSNWVMKLPAEQLLAFAERLKEKRRAAEEGEAAPAPASRPAPPEPEILAPAAPPIRPAPRAGDPPLSFAQERLWFLDRLEPGKPLYNMATTLRLRGPLDAAALAASYAAVV